MSRRGYSLIELMGAILLATGALALLFQAILLANRWAAASRQAMREEAEGELLHRTLVELLARGRLVSELSIAPDGALREADAPDAIQRWSAAQGTLVVRGDDAYWLLLVEGKRLTRVRVGFEGAVERGELLTGVAGLALVPARRGGETVGVEWRLERGGRTCSGFVAARRETTPPAAPAAPRLAPRWERGGGR